MPGPTLSAKLDPDILLKLGDLKKASAGVNAGIREIERNALKAQQAGTALDKEQQTRLTRFEQVDAEIRKRLASEQAAVERAEELAKRSAVFERAAKNMETLAGLDAQGAIQGERKLAKLSKSPLAVALLSGGDISTKAVADAVKDTVLEKFANNLVGGMALLKVGSVAIEKVAKAVEDHQQYKKFEGNYATRLANGNVSEGERLAHDSQLSDKWWRKIGLDPEEAVKTVREAGSAVSSLKAGDAYGIVGKSFNDVTRKMGFGQGVFALYGGSKEFANRVKAETEKTISRGIDITPEVESRIRKDAVEHIIGSLYASGNDKEAHRLKDALEKNVKEFQEKQHREKSRYEVEKEEAKKRTDDFVLNNFKQENWHRWRDFKVPANFRD
jgi:hypothetical protein